MSNGNMVTTSSCACDKSDSTDAVSSISFWKIGTTFGSLADLDEVSAKTRAAAMASMHELNSAAGVIFPVSSDLFEADSRETYIAWHADRTTHVNNLFRLSKRRQLLGCREGDVGKGSDGNDRDGACFIVAQNAQDLLKSWLFGAFDQARRIAQRIADGARSRVWRYSSLTGHGERRVLDYQSEAGRTREANTRTL